MLEKMRSKVEEDESLAKAYGDIVESDVSIDNQINKALEGSGSVASASDNLAAMKAKMGIS